MPSQIGVLPKYGLILATAAGLSALIWNLNERPDPIDHTVHEKLIETFVTLESRISGIEARLGKIPTFQEQMPATQLWSERLEDIETKLIALEEDLQTLLDSEESPEPHLSTRLQKSEISSLASSLDERGTGSRPELVAATAFENANNLISAHRVDLENVEHIFDQQELEHTDLSRIDCREAICRLEYVVDPRQDRTTLALEENEFLAALGAKYGNGTKFHLKQSPSGKNVVYIELAK